jgi:hypothetical protein
VGHGAAGVRLEEVERGAAVDDPVGQHLPRTRPGEEAHRVEPAGRVVVPDAGDLAEVVDAVGGEALGPAEEQPDADVPEHRDPPHHPVVEGRQVVPVLPEGRELGVGRDALRGPRTAPGLEEADHELAGVVLHVGPVVAGLERRHVGGKVGDVLGHDVVVVERLQGQADAGARGHLPPPHPGAVHDVLRLDVARGGAHPDRPALAEEHILHRHALEDGRAAHARAAGQGHGGVRRVAPPVVGKVERPDHAGGVEEREELGHPAGAHEVHLDPAAAAGRRLASQLLPALRAEGEVQGPGPPVAGAETGHLLEVLEDLDAASDDGAHAVRGPGGRHETGGVPGGARREAPALEKEDIRPPPPGQVVRGRAPDDAPADHHDLGPARKRASLRLGPARQRASLRLGRTRQSHDILLASRPRALPSVHFLSICRGRPSTACARTPRGESGQMAQFRNYLSIRPIACPRGRRDNHPVLCGGRRQ